MTLRLPWPRPLDRNVRNCLDSLPAKGPESVMMRAILSVAGSADMALARFPPF